METHYLKSALERRNIEDELQCDSLVSGKLGQMAQDARLICEYGSEEEIR